LRRADDAPHARPQRCGGARGQNLHVADDPSEIVSELDKHIVGQHAAKRAVAIALRNRWRRQQVPEPLRQEITPKNILMIGPTGVGKTEIARRLARLADAPFIKVEATKFTEVGYVGRDVDTIIRDLAEARSSRRARPRRARCATARPTSPRSACSTCCCRRARGELRRHAADRSATRQKFRKMLREGTLDDARSRSRSRAAAADGDHRAARHGGADEPDPGHVPADGRRRRKVKRMSVGEALKTLTDEEAGKLVNDDEIKAKALAAVEQNGIVFLDEIDKIASRQETHGADVSRQGVQRDLLPLVEGTTVSTKYGMVRTDHILFIASGGVPFLEALRLDPRAAGALPDPRRAQFIVRCDFEKILTATDACLVRQYQALLDTENVHLDFTPDGIRRLAEIAFAVNEKQENIGARRLYTVMERLLDDLSFHATPAHR
jgi:ATP-dependent HslUV protease ATP-binding subunit HslU